MALIETDRLRPKNAEKDVALRDWVRALEAIAPIAANPHRLLPHIIEQLAQTQSDAPALLSAGETFSYGTLAARANRFARWALDQGLAKDDTVCLMMPNRPEYVAIWLGLCSIGVTVALRSFAAIRSRIASTSQLRSTSLPLRNITRSFAPRRRKWKTRRRSGCTATTAINTSESIVLSNIFPESRSRQPNAAQPRSPIVRS
jgi:acyl-CoA synthetase (AMP-forming)/AMP-acid ligase II